MKYKSLMALIFCGLLMVGCKSQEVPVGHLVMANAGHEVDGFQDELTTRPVPNQDYGQRLKQVRLISVGDVMVHRSQLSRADKNGVWDFDRSFAPLKGVLNSADLTIGNLETTLAGPYNQVPFSVDKFYKGYSGYPTFNSPDELAAALSGAGFDLVFTANNHSLDSYETGLMRTLKVLEDHDLATIGTYLDKEASETFYIQEIQGIRIGFVNYTYAMNGFSPPPEKDYIIHHLGNYDPGRIDHMMNQVKKLDGLVDLTVVGIHYGVEYQHEPDKRYQIPIIEGLIDAGADILLGSHPHVLQPIEIFERPSGGQGVVIYSQGNFLSSQKYAFTKENTDIGVVFEVGLSMVDDEDVSLEYVGFMPTYTYWNQEDIMVIPVYQDGDDYPLSTYDMNRIEVAKNQMVPLLEGTNKGSFEFDGTFFRYFLK